MDIVTIWRLRTDKLPPTMLIRRKVFIMIKASSISSILAKMMTFEYKVKKAF